jgi:hypothetical protein
LKDVDSFSLSSLLIDDDIFFLCIGLKSSFDFEFSPLLKVGSVNIVLLEKLLLLIV